MHRLWIIFHVIHRQWKSGSVHGLCIAKTRRKTSNCNKKAPESCLIHRGAVDEKNGETGLIPKET